MHVAGLFLTIVLADVPMVQHIADFHGLRPRLAMQACVEGRRQLTRETARAGLDPRPRLYCVARGRYH